MSTSMFCTDAGSCYWNWREKRKSMTNSWTSCRKMWGRDKCFDLLSSRFGFRQWFWKPTVQIFVILGKGITKLKSQISSGFHTWGGGAGILITIILSQISSEAIWEDLNSKLSWGGMPPDPRTLMRAHRALAHYYQSATILIDIYCIVGPASCDNHCHSEYQIHSHTCGWV